MNAIKITSLYKKYNNKVEALKGIDLKIKQGSFYGLLGPNGAGKTTTIGIISGLTKLSSGTVKILGYDAIKDYRNARKLIGLSPQELNFDLFFPIHELLTLQAGYYGLPLKQAKERTELMLNQFGLLDKANAKARELSGGMKRRIQIAKALIHNPPIVILDEPTAGVDIELRYMLWEYLKKINKEGKTILLTTHYIEEAEKLCDTISIINDGKIMVEGSPKELMRKHGKSGLEITLNETHNNIKLPNWDFTVKKNKIKVLSDNPEKDLLKITNTLNEKQYNVIGVEIFNSSLEDVFINITGKQMNELDGSKKNDL